jgi:hypothetical protein
MLLSLLCAVQQLTSGAATPYWQQHVVYQIDARLDEPSHTLAGREQLHYVNHSPDTLHTVAFHLYLNAFRPGSRWSEADAAERQHRFDTLKDPAYGFNHVRGVTIDGVPAVALYPLAPDSTIVRFVLPKALAPGDSLDVAMQWDARPSTVPRRQGRRGRSYDFAQWYPKVVVYDQYGGEEHALYPAGEFYGEFGDFLVHLDLPADQVVAATGVPVCGDPGWKHANRGRETPPIVLIDSTATTGTYPGSTVHYTCRPVAVPPSGSPPDSTRKQLLWVARDVHNFAMSMSPDYRYEAGEWNGIQVHVLYQPGDEKTWGNGVVVNNTITTLKWLNFLFGTYPWPQMTVVHRIEAGGTEFPMMQMDGSPSLGLNLHEGGHSYLMGILANNEWREGWMDEGFTSFQTTWFEELQAHSDAATRNLESGMVLSDLDGESQPVSTISDKFRDFDTYNDMIYGRGELFLQELRRLLGDQTMLQVLGTYYARWQLHHVDEAAFRAVAEAVSHRDLSTFFAQWLHSVVLTDYAIGHLSRTRTDSGWRTRITVARRAPGEFPVTVAVFAEHDTMYRQIDGIAQQETATITTRSKPLHVAIDPFELSHDWNVLNNQRYFALPRRLLVGDQPVSVYADDYFSPRASRDRLTIGLMPTAWYNRIGGVTLGVRTSTDYLGRFDQNVDLLSCSTGAGAHDLVQRKECDFWLVLNDPTWLQAAHLHQQLRAFHVEGRVGGGVQVERIAAAHQAFGPTRTAGVSLNWVATFNTSYLPPALWDNGGSVEAALWWGVTDTRANWALSFNARAAAGVMYSNPAPGFTTVTRYDAQLYARPEITATARRGLGRRTTFAVRGYAGWTRSDDRVLTQRRIFAAGADPYQTLGDPFLRSVGAPLLRDDCWCRWHTPGGGDLRGYSESLSTAGLGAVNVELERTVAHPDSTLFRRIGVALFADVGVLDHDRGIGGVGDTLSLPASHSVLGDAGVGIRIAQRIGRLSWVTRLDFPLYVSDPEYAIAQRLRHFALDRLVVSLSPVIP